ncbi:MAG: hypothetical protein ABSF58_07795 [Solirubrobacteraceae bacterium]|jgi:hypothetical protein
MEPPGALLRGEARAAPLAGLAGISASEYLSFPPLRQRAVRLEIERELARRRELLSASDPAPRAKLRAAAARATGSGGRGVAAPSAPLTRRARQFGSREP